MCAWAYAKSPFHRQRLEAAGFHPDQLKTLDDLRRIPFMTREEWMESIGNKPLFGDLLATDPENAIRYHLTSGTSGRTPIRVLDSMKDWEWITEMWCYGFWGFGVRPERHGLLRLRLRLVHRLLGRALRLREDRRARRARRRADHRGACQADRRPRRHHRLLHADLRAAALAAGHARWASTSPKRARWTRSCSPASRPARSPPSSANSKRRGARSAPTPPG